MTTDASSSSSPPLADAAVVASDGRDWWGVVWFALGAVAGAHRLSDNSFLTHLATGRLLLDHGAPRVDPYSFTAAGRPWVVQSWLFSLVEAGLERVAGPWAIRWLFGLVLGALAALVWRLSRPAGSLVARAMLTVGAGVVGLGFWNERPQTFAFALLAVTLVLLIDEHRPIALAGVFLVWVNVHGSWPIGLLVVGLFMVRRVIDDRCWGRDAWDPIAASLLGTLAGAALSPYGIELLTFPVRLLGHADVLRYIVEWRRPELTDPLTWVFVAQVLVAIWALRRTHSWTWAPLIVVTVLLAATSRRNIPLASLVMVPAIAPALVGIGSTPSGRPLSLRRSGVAVAAIALVAAVFVATTPSDYDLTPYPTTAVDWMARRGLVAQQSVHVVAPDYVGNYLEWRYGPAANVFVDDRAEVFDAAVIGDYAEGLLDDRRPWAEVLDRYRADVVLWPADQLLARELRASSAWHVGHRGGGWIVACRIGSPAVSC